MPASTHAGLRIRPMKTTDVEAIIGIDSIITGEEKAGFWRGMLTLYQPAEESGSGVDELPGSDHVAAVATPTYLCRVAEVDGRIVGFILGDVQAWHFGIPRCGRIIVMGVLPNHRRSGIASGLAGELLLTFRKMNLPVVQCLVRPGDPLGEFFASLGFGPTPWIMLERKID